MEDIDGLYMLFYKPLNAFLALSAISDNNKTGKSVYCRCTNLIPKERFTTKSDKVTNTHFSYCNCSVVTKEQLEEIKQIDNICLIRSSHRKGEQPFKVYNFKFKDCDVFKVKIELQIN